MHFVGSLDSFGHYHTRFVSIVDLFVAPFQAIYKRDGHLLL